MVEQDYVLVQKEVKPMPPSGWQEMPFSEALQINPTVRLDRGSNYPYVDMASVNADLRNADSVEEREFKGGGSKFQSGDTLMARITPCLENGKIARYHTKGDQQVAHGSTEFIVIRGRENVTDNDFVYYLTQWNEVRNYAIGQMTGTSGRQRVPVDSLDHLTVEIPPLDEQRAIAHVLGTLDDKIELNRRMNETLEEMVRALFKSWFVDFDPVRAKMEGQWQRGESLPGLPADLYDLFPDRIVDSDLGEIPEGWEFGTVSQLAERIQNGGTPKRSEPTYWYTRDIPWLTSSEVRQSFVLDTQSYISRLGLEQSSAKIIPARSILVALYGATAGQVSMNIYPLTTNQAVSAIIPCDGNRYFCLVSLKSKVGELGNRAVGSAQQNISKQAVESTNVVLPSIELRFNFDIMVKGLFERIYRNLEESHALVAQRDALLPGLVSGQLKLESV